MTSEIRVNKLTNRIGLSTVTFADSGIGVTVTGRIDPDTDSARDLGTTSVRWRNAYVDTYYGDGSNLTGISADKIIEGDTKVEVVDAGSQYIVGEVNGSEKIRILSDGQVKLTGTNSGNHMSTFGGNVGGLTIDDVGNQHSALEVQHGSNKFYYVSSSNNSNYISSYGTGRLAFEHTGTHGGTRERLTIAANGNIGVNQTSPQRILHIGTTGTAEANIRLQGGADYFELRVKDSDNAFGIHKNIAGGGSSEVLRIDSNGEVLIGATARGREKGFHLAGANQDPTGVWTQMGIYSTDSQAANKGGSLGFGGHDGSVAKQQFAAIKGAKENGTSGNYAGYMAFYTRPAGSVSGERMRINSNGSLSIANTRNYYGALNVEKTSTSSSAIDIKASGAGSYAQAISFGDHNTISGELKIKNSTDITLGTSSNHPFVLLGNNVAGLKISNSNGRLERNFGAGSGHTADGMWFNNSVTATGYFVRFWQTSGGYGANQIGSITHTAYNTQYNTSSDYRLKENDVKISDGIIRLKQLRPIRFNWKSDSSTTEDGFFAHEAAMVVPEAVTGTKDDVADSDSPDIGQKAGDPIHQGMDYGKITPLLTAALQEAVAKIEKLEQDNIALRARVTNLEGN